MKRTVLVAAALIGLGAVIYVGKLWAQTGGNHPAAAAAPQTKIAVINLAYVIKNYDKVKVFQQEIKTAAAPFQETDKKLTTQGEALFKERNNPATSSERKEAIEKQLMELKRQAEDNKANGTKELSKRQEQGFTTIYMDVYNVAQKIATSRGFEMVLQFNDLTDPREYWGPQNIMRKLQFAGCMPMYYNAGLDISHDVVTTLNSGYKNNAPNNAARPAGH